MTLTLGTFLLALVVIAAGGVLVGRLWAAAQLVTKHGVELRKLEREHRQDMVGLYEQVAKEFNELHERHADQLANMASYGRLDGRKPAEVLDTAPPEDEVAIREMEMTAMTRYVQEQSPGISEEKAREEAMRMLAVATGEGY